MGPISTIVCAYDFSETADLALERACALARQHDARIVLAHVIEAVPIAGYPAIVPLPSDGTLRDIVSKKLEERAGTARTADVRIDTSLHTGDPRTRLLEVASGLDADLIVIGTRGLTGVRHALLGSVAEWVVRRSTVPVLTIHPEDEVVAASLRTILVPTDLSPEAEVATDVFEHLFAKGPRPRVLLVHADRMPPYLEPFAHSVLELTDQPDPIRDEMLSRMAPLAQALEDDGFEVDCRVVDGEAADAIPDCAAEESVDMIVLSTHGRSAIANALLGRTAQRIVQNAPCPTLTVRAPARD